MLLELFNRRITRKKTKIKRNHKSSDKNWIEGNRFLIVRNNVLFFSKRKDSSSTFNAFYIK